jgi:glutathione S-transferase
MSIDLYGNMLSQPTRSVIVFCELSGIPYTYHDVLLYKREQKTKEFLQLNPFGQVPVIVHDGFNLWESGAIVIYLADAFNVDSDWFPADIKKRSRISAYLNWHLNNTRVHCRSVPYYTIIGPLFYSLPPITDEHRAILDNNLENFFVEFNEMVNGKYLCGDSLSIADVFAFNELFNLKICDKSFSHHPHITKWYNEIYNIEIVRNSLEQAENMINLIKTNQFIG